MLFCVMKQLSQVNRWGLLQRFRIHLHMFMFINMKPTKTLRRILDRKLQLPRCQVPSSPQHRIPPGSLEFQQLLDSTWWFIVSIFIGFHLVVKEFQQFTGFHYRNVHSTAKTSKIDTCQNGILCLFKKQESKILLCLNFIGYSPARLYCVYWTRPSQSVPPNLRRIGSQTIEYSGLNPQYAGFVVFQ